MVNQFFVLLFLLASFDALAMTAEELRRIAGDAERSQRERAQRIQATDLNSLLPRLENKQKISEKEQLKKNGFSEHQQKQKVIESAATSPATSVAGAATQENNIKPRRNAGTPRERARTPGAPRAITYGKPQSHSNSGVGKVSASTAQKRAVQLVSDGKPSLTQPNNLTEKTRQAIPNPPYVYVAPARYSSTNNSASSSKSSDAVVAKQRRFGIRIGAWFSARMNRETTNFDPGLIEIRVLEDVVGDNRTLPSGSLLFANKIFNKGTKRLDLKIIKGLLPDGEEIVLDGLVYDSSRVAGLHGIVVENDAGAIASGFKKGLVDAGSSIVSTAVGGTPAGMVLDSAVGAVADAKQAATAAETAAPYTIHVSPQPVLVQVQATF